MNDNTCNIIRDGIDNKINDLDKRIKISIDNLNEKIELTTNLHSDLLR